MALLNPWVIVGVLVVLGVSSGGAFFYGEHIGRSMEISSKAEQDKLLRDVADRAQESAAIAISQIQIVNKTSKQVLEREIKTVPDYSRCLNSVDGLRAINDALTGVESKPVSNNILPGTHAVN